MLYLICKVSATGIGGKPPPQLGCWSTWVVERARHIAAEIGSLLSQFDNPLPYVSSTFSMALGFAIFHLFQGHDLRAEGWGGCTTPIWGSPGGEFPFRFPSNAACKVGCGFVRDFRSFIFFASKGSFPQFTFWRASLTIPFMMKAP